MFILTSDLKKETSEINSALYLVVVIPNYMNEKYETYYVGLLIHDIQNC